jgi:DNA invertase Pin-like site-specific DNA recombinase
MKTQNSSQQPRICFSYIRFSSDNQKGNSSVDRQSDIAPKIAAQNGWLFREDLNAKDLAVSAFKGDNIKTLKAIIEAVKAGKIPLPAVMVCEAWDRFSRAELDTADDLMKEMLRSGLELYIYRGGHHLTRESLNKPIDRIIALLELAAANEYSAKLSERVRASYKSRYQKLLNGERGIKMNNLPRWIDRATMKPNDKANTVAALFQMYLDGKGSSVIARELNQKNVPTLRGRGNWGQGTVYDLLSDRQVLGEYKAGGEVVKGFLPQIVSDELFAKVQARMEDNRSKRPCGNETGHIANLFSGVAYCRCGQRIKVTGGKRASYVMCYNQVARGTKACSEPLVRYDALEAAFVKLLNVNPVQLIRDDNTPNAAVDILRGQLAANEKEADNITKSLGIVVTKRLALRQAELETEAEDIKRNIQLEAAKTVSAKGGAERLEQIFKRLGSLETDSEFRVEVQAWIRANINRIAIDRIGKTFTVDLKNGNLVKMGLDGSVIECKSFVSLFTGQPVQAVQQAVSV